MGGCFLGLLLSGVLWLGTAPPLLAQEVAASEPSPEATEGPAEPSVLGTLQEFSPPALQELFVQKASDIATAPVWLDGRQLFFVAAPAIDDENKPNPMSAKQRSREIERRLQRLVQTRINPETLTVTWDWEEQSNQPIIYGNDQFLFTVTSLDAQLQGHNSLEVRANEITRILREALVRYHRERQSTYLWESVKWATGILIMTLLGHYALADFRRRLRFRKVDLLEAPEAEAAFATQGLPQEATTALRQQMKNREKRGIIDLQRALLKIAQGSLWAVSLYFVLGLFPYTRWLQVLLLNLLKLPIRIGILLLITYWLLRLGTVWIDRLFIALQESASLAPQPSQRLMLRFSTFSQVTKSILGLVLLVIAALVGMTLLGLQIGPLLTGAGLVGLAISLASQSLIQDFINGFLILFEDHYGVGDVIIVGDVWGFVETMNLRITQLRNEEGRLITIPNSKISIVQNLSKEWSRVDLMIPVALSADINKALALVEEVANTLRQDSIWGQLILEPPLLLGVDKLDHVGATIRIWIKTQPLKQWDVAREYRRRLKLAFEAANIPMGIPHYAVHMAPGDVYQGLRNGEGDGHSGDQKPIYVPLPSGN